MKLLRLIVVLAVLGYAGWLAWPFISPLVEGSAAAARVGEALPAGEAFGVLPVWVLWAGAIGLYLVAALMLGAGNTRAAVAYFLAFAADVVLRLAINGEGEISARSAGPTTMAAPEAVQNLPVEPVWLVLGALFLLGVLVIVASRRIRRKRTAGQLNF
ncbi:hypothetical protein [Brevundimonas sp. Root1423]|uniref:hypothetical protein n=1 Tax=Brevundimonas sp. Root1423 TaxID=1736462 RepID=UPI0006FF4B9F|nr:hypothetical protein [Brevundimonas sp. Root1423]KQY89604.1 hypothetical protein ASD25_03290 [Brevundimonas sp. Root1423]